MVYKWNRKILLIVILKHKTAIDSYFDSLVYKFFPGFKEELRNPATMICLEGCLIHNSFKVLTTSILYSSAIFRKKIAIPFDNLSMSFTFSIFNLAIFLFVSSVIWRGVIVSTLFTLAVNSKHVTTCQPNLLNNSIKWYEWKQVLY